MIKVNYLPTDNDENIVFESQNITEPTTDRSLKNIKKTLIYSLRNTYGIKDKEKINDISDELLRIHGLHKDNFDFVKQVGVAIQENINEFSIDSNANKSEKNPRSVITEVVTPVSKLIGYDYLYQIMRELYSKEEAKRLSGLMYDYTLALADSSSILLPYCFAIDASRIITEGKLFGQLESGPAHRIDSYVSVLNEVVHTLSNNLAGAIAVSTFFIDIAHLGIYRENITLKKLKKNKNIRKYIENQYQKVVHGFNSLSRNGGSESPFTNISLLDRTKLETVLNEDNGYLDMLFISSKKSKVFRKSGIKVKDRQKWKKYVIEYIIELEKIYLTFFDKGDPRKDKMPLRFPISTLNCGKLINDNNEWYIPDQEFLNTICNHEIMRYNIFVSEGTKFSSCCFIGDELIEVLENDKSYSISIKNFVDKFIKEREGQKHIEKKYKIFSINPFSLEKELCYIVGVLKKENTTKELVKIKINNKVNIVSADHVYLVKDKISLEVKEISAKELAQNYTKYLILVEGNTND